MSKISRNFQNNPEHHRVVSSSLLQPLNKVFVWSFHVKAVEWRWIQHCPSGLIGLVIRAVGPELCFRHENLGLVALGMTKCYLNWDLSAIMGWDWLCPGFGVSLVELSRVARVLFYKKTTFPRSDSSGQTQVSNLAWNALGLRQSAPMGSVLALEAAPGRGINPNMGVPCQVPASSQEFSLPLPTGLADIIITGNFFLSPAQEELQVMQPQ